jgi:hypothetical protein
MFATVSDEISKVLDLSSASADFIFSDQGLFKFLTLNRSREELGPGRSSGRLGFCLRVLEFKLNLQEGGFASVARDRCHIFLCEGDQGSPGSWVGIGVGDAAALFEEYESR